MPIGIYKRKYDFVTKEFLDREYIVNRKTKQQVTNIIGCSITVIRNKLIKFNIPIRTASEAMRGRKFTLKWRKNLSEAKKGNKGGYIDGGTIIQHYCKEPNCYNKICYYNWKRGSRKCRSCATKELWQREKYRSKVIKIQCKRVKNLWKDKKFRRAKIRSLALGRCLRPNVPEKQLNKLLQKILPNEYRYVGNGEILFSDFNPDFINCNGQKKIIELYGDYWHNLPSYKERDKRRLIAYNRYGYKTLIIWQHELSSLNKIEKKVLIFNRKGGNSG